MESDASILTHAAPVHTAAAPPSPTHVAWNAVLGGTAVAVATWMLLQLLGFGIGLSAVDVASSSSLQASAVGAGVWGIAAPVIAFFIGGLVAGRAAASGVDRAGSVIAGLVTWAVSAIAGIIIIGMALSSLVGGAVSVGTSAASAATDVVGKAATGLVGQADQMGDVVQAMGIDADDALAPVNQRLHAEGKPEVTAPQLESAARSVLREALRAGKLDRAMLVRTIAQRTALSEADAADIAGRVQVQYDKARAELDAKIAEAKNAALRAAQTAADSTGKLMLALFGALALAAAAAVGGAALGGRSVRQTGNRRLPVRTS